ncbi:MAG: ribonuclease P protein component [Candidatus Andersenbacteria bacterium]|nr:ribonuclease P protein component [Candidatus Andersenbacteria bacterium]
MLPHKHRLTRAPDIRAVLRHGRPIRSRYVIIRLLPRPAGNDSRAACIVTKRVHASAVRRHKYQRLLRAALRELLPRLPQPYDIVVTATPSMNQLTHSRPLQAALAAACQALLRQL